MAKKKLRLKIQSVFIAAEGKREQEFIHFLQELFDPEKNVRLAPFPETGGSSNAVLDRALKHLFYDKVYAWFDEDDELDSEHRHELEKCWGVKLSASLRDTVLQEKNKKLRNPVVVVSSPLSVEGIIIRLFDKNLPKLREPLRSPENLEYNKKIMKEAVDGIFKNLSDTEYYRAHLTKEFVLMKAETMPEIKLLLSIFEF